MAGRGARRAGTAAPISSPLNPNMPCRSDSLSPPSSMAMLVATKRAITEPIAMAICPTVMAPQTIAARKNSPVSGLF